METENFKNLYNVLNSEIKRIEPMYDRQADYQTNSKSYYDYLAKLKKLFELLSNRIWEYDEELKKRFDEWDKLIEKFPENVEKLLIEWLKDGTLEEIINVSIFENLNKKIETIDKEVIAARGGSETLGERLDSEKAEFTAHLAQMESVHPLYFDGSVPLTDVIDEATAKNKKIKIPAGTYIIDTPIINDLNVIDLEIEGEGSTEGQPKTRLLWRGGAGTMFKFTNTRQVMFKDIEISGFNPGDETRVVIGATGIKSTGVVKLYNVVLMGFETLMEWAGGYYHSFHNCIFKFFTHGFKDFNANNVIFNDCKIAEFKRLINFTGGDGPTVFNHCSIEKWTKTVINGSSGASPIVNITNSYIENYENITPPAGVNGDYKASNVIVGCGIINMLGNTIVTNGIKRVIYSGGATKRITSMNNRIRFKQNNSNLEFYIYKTSAVETVYANDTAIDGLIQDGTFTPLYINSTNGLKDEDSYVYDAFKKERVHLSLQSWHEASLSNGWLHSAVSGVPSVSYKKDGRLVKLLGAATGTGSTDLTIFTLPEGYRPNNLLHFPTNDTSGTAPSTITIRTTGRVQASEKNNNILLNGIQFEI